VQAQGFQSITVNVATRHGQIGHANIRMAVAAVETEVQVGDNSDGVNSDRGAGTTTLGTKEVEQLPDDPTDLLRELQTLAASAGGDPAATQVVVDGFQNGSAMPPKSSIASIRINPDIFAPEYQSPLWNGGRLEITTKAGADRFHGALYLTDSDGRFNATDPFSVTATPAGKRRYGFELSGPLVSKKTDFAIALEKRDIDEFNVVNATNLKPSGIPTQLQQTVDAPQRLWIASARGDWQITPKDTVTLSFSANVNNLGNQGVGGLILAEAGYNSLQSEYDLRFSNAFIANANVLNQTRVGFSWKRTQQSPFSSAPLVQVSGYFTGGGATSQNLNDRERDLEIDDDLLISHGRHSLKVGIQTLGLLFTIWPPTSSTERLSSVVAVRQPWMRTTIQPGRPKT
jgi:hypothetical protein